MSLFLVIAMSMISGLVLVAFATQNSVVSGKGGGGKELPPEDALKTILETEVDQSPADVIEKTSDEGLGV